MIPGKPSFPGKQMIPGKPSFPDKQMIPGKPITGDMFQQKEEKPNIIQLLKDKKPIPILSKDGKVDLVKPTETNIKKIETILKDKNKLQLIKDKNIIDFEDEQLRDLDIVVNEYNYVNEYYYKLLDEFQSYKKRTKNIEKKGIRLLLQKEREIDSLKKIIIQLRNNLDIFKNACKEEVAGLKIENEEALSKKEEDFRAVFEYLKQLFNNEIRVQLANTKDKLNSLKDQNKMDLLAIKDQSKGKTPKKKKTTPRKQKDTEKKKKATPRKQKDTEKKKKATTPRKQKDTEKKKKTTTPRKQKDTEKKKKETPRKQKDTEKKKKTTPRKQKKGKRSKKRC